MGITRPDDGWMATNRNTLRGVGDSKTQTVATGNTKETKMKYEVDAKFTLNCKVTVEAENTAQAKEFIKNNCTAYGGIKSTEKARGLLEWEVDENAEMCLGKARAKKDHESITESDPELKTAV